MTKLSDSHAALLESTRGIPAKLAESLGMGSRGDKVGFEYRRLPHPIPPVFTKWVKAGVADVFEPKRDLIPWGLDALKAKDAPLKPDVIIVGDEFERMSLMHAGFKTVISLPDKPNPGKETFTPGANDAFAWMWEGDELLYELQSAGRIIIALTDDVPGRLLRDAIARRISQDRCWIVAHYPSGCKTLNKVLLDCGESSLRTLIDSAIPMLQNRLAPVSEIEDMGEREQYGTGWSTLDPHLKICPPELFIVTGKPGDGKSNFTLNLCLNLARIHNLPGSYIQFEDNAMRMKRDILSYADYWFSNPDQDGVLVDKAEWADWACKIIKPAEEEEDVRNLSWVRSTIHEAVVRHGSRWVVLDPWNELEHVWGQSKSEADYLNAAVRELKRLSRRYNIALGIVAHPDKNAGVNQSAEMMNLYSISGGAVWANKADHGIIVAREVGSTGPTGASIINVVKCKDHALMGIPGSARFEFEHKTRTYLARP
jgi:twinkle protein